MVLPHLPACKFHKHPILINHLLSASCWTLSALRPTGLWYQSPHKTPPNGFNGSLQSCNLKSHPRVEALPRTLSQLELQIAVTWDFPALFKSGYRSAQFGDVNTVTSLYCFYFFSFNNCILKLSNNLLWKIEIVYLSVMNVFFCQQILWT